MAVTLAKDFGEHETVIEVTEVVTLTSYPTLVMINDGQETAEPVLVVGGSGTTELTIQRDVWGFPRYAHYFGESLTTLDILTSGGGE